MKPKIVIEDGIPAPVGRRLFDCKLGALRKAIAELKPDQSFLWPENTRPYRAAKEIGVKVALRKEDRNGYRVWRRE